MNSLRTHAVAGAFGAAMAMTAGTVFAECSTENWRDCAGKPWVDGSKMETPLGSKWWPNPLWGGG